MTDVLDDKGQINRVRCGACGAAPPHRNIVMLDVMAQWDYPTVGNVISGDRGRAVGVICDACVEADRETTEAVQWRPDGQILYHPIAELQTAEPWATKIYHVFRIQSGVGCNVHDLQGTDYALPHWSLHSPTGFEVGYGGSGPADLALAIAADHYGVPTDYDFRKTGTDGNALAEKAWKLHQPLKWAYLASASVRDGLKISDREISAVAREAGVDLVS